MVDHRLPDTPCDLLPVDADVWVRQPRTRNHEKGTVVGMSARGCRLCLDEVLPAGTNVQVRFRNMEPRDGVVLSAEDGFIAVSFEIPMHQIVVEHFARDNPPEYTRTLAELR